MRYVIEPNETRPTHRNGDGAGVRVIEIADAAAVHTKWPIVESLDGYTAITPPATRESIEATFNAAIAAGITAGGITLAAADADRNAFAQRTTLFNTVANSMGSEFPAFASTNTTVVRDKNGLAHTMTIAQFLTLMIGYGQAFDTLWTTRANALAELGGE